MNSCVRAISEDKTTFRGDREELDAVWNIPVIKPFKICWNINLIQVCHISNMKDQIQLEYFDKCAKWPKKHFKEKTDGLKS